VPGTVNTIDQTPLLRSSVRQQLTLSVNPTPNAGRTIAGGDHRALQAQRRVGWQPSRFLTDRAEAERAFQLAEQLGSVNAAAHQLGTTWPSLRKAFTRHGLGMPTRNPEAVRQRAIEAARQRTGQPVASPLDPVFVALNPHALPARPRSPAELYQWARREEQYATLGANVVVELHSESHARQPTTRAWAIIRRAERSHRLAGQRASRPDRRHADRADRASRSQQSQEREMVADTPLTLGIT
jgi:hypothetical protein